MVVNHVTWHPTDPDLIAVAYGFLDEEDQTRSRGLVACWTIANLEHPTRIFSFNSPVCKVSFAELQNYLAVGLYSGEISGEKLSQGLIHNNYFSSYQYQG